MFELDKLWFNGNLYKVKKILSPSKREKYILAYRVNKHLVYPDDSHPIDMVLIGVHSDAFYPDTAEVRKLLKLQKIYERKVKETKGKLDDIWLNTTDEFGLIE